MFPGSSFTIIAVVAVVLLVISHRLLRSDQGTWKRGTAPRFLFVFAVGLSFGFALATLLLSPYSPYDSSAMMRPAGNTKMVEVKPDDAFGIQQLHHKMDINSTFASELLTGLEEVRARRVAQEVRVLCWIMTTPKNHMDKAFHVKTTWGRHCNTLLFMSEGDDPELPSVKLEVPVGREGLWAKTVEAFKYVHKHHKGEYDWVLKADDDTYVIVENLRSMLLPYTPDDPIHFGFHFKPFTPQGYMSGGAGYVLSSESVDRLVQAIDKKHVACKGTDHTGSEDVNMGVCLHGIGVKAGDSRDAEGRSRFFPFDVETHVNPNLGDKNWWYWDYIYWPMNAGLSCCSDKPISFHYMTPTKFYMLEYLAYHVKPFAVMHLSTAEPPKHKEEESEEAVTTVPEVKKDEVVDPFPPYSDEEEDTDAAKKTETKVENGVNSTVDNKATEAKVEPTTVADQTKKN